MSETTPMMAQYFSIKNKHQDCILLYRLGDFYEMFFEDAKKASQVLDLTLTSRNKNQADSVPLCGIPYHAAQTYINKLLATGHKVAICEQTEDPKKAKGLVKREVVQILSPGLVFDPESLEGKAPNYLASILFNDHKFGLSYVDISTGCFKLIEVLDEDKLMAELSRLEPKEILVPQEGEGADWVEKLRSLFPVRLACLGGWYYDRDFGEDLFIRYYKLSSEALGLNSHPVGAMAAGALLGHLNDSKLLQEHILSQPKIVFTSEFLHLDENAKRHLELTQTMATGERQGSLLWLIDQASSSMGSRQIREWMLYPLTDLHSIQRRQDAVGEFVENASFLDSVQSLLQGFADLERIQNRILAEQASPREFKALAYSLEKIPAIKDCLCHCSSALLKSLWHTMEDLSDVQNLIGSTLVDDPSLALKEGGIIREGVNKTLDELRDVEKNGKFIISTMETQEREATGISSLKIRFNNVFGYYIEITNVHKEKAPAHYIRKQTLSNAERFITPALKEYEDKVLGAAEKIKELEYGLFLELRVKVAAQSERIKKLATHLATLDALAGLASLASQRNYVRPVMVDLPLLNLTKSRHPIIEALLDEAVFVPNDIFLEGKQASLMMITGPNMAGKSTLMRQAALIVIMAQMGGFVPAAEARIGLTDRIFTRIGASDHLQKGQSTFMVEMLETAHILKQATPQSLILLDEIGRGTSTFDGLSIAWSVAETIHDKIGARTFFATHYHELTDLAEEKPGIKNYHMAVKEWNGEIRFLRELKEGGTNRSYGVSVAAMAGLPSHTITRARELLKILEQKDLQFQAEAASGFHQPSLFEERKSLVEEELKKIDVNAITPLSALNLLAELKKMVGAG
ncbi:MAG TPA: DNA mismatch repair protein MutS [Deltaproteobacteria bacterium]|nr:MAG: DNA mismatch repair protein MutS [Deltaproteobacteria bacterium GWA2_45_12]HBF12242.1 DNA mismatch repair protein MutS [Deltaproteobacteria bacterium]